MIGKSLIALLLVVLVGAVAVRGVRDAGDGPRRFDVVAVAPAPAPDFSLPGLDGRSVRLAELRGRVVVLNFWATWCEPCREELPGMQALADHLADRGLVVLAVNYEERADAVRSYAGEAALTVPVLLDHDGAVARRYGVTGLPASFFVDRRGALVGSLLGFRDWRTGTARAYVDGLLGRPG